MIPYENYKIYGPYKSKKGHKFVIARNEKSKQFTISLPKYLMEINLGRYLEEGEIVEHIDQNQSHNNISNYRLIDLRKIPPINLDSLKPGKYICPICCIEFIMDEKRIKSIKRDHYRYNLKPVLFCGKRCASKHNSFAKKKIFVIE